MDADAVARIGLESLAAGRAVVIPGMINKLSIGSLRLVPERMIALMAGWMMAKLV
jgi:short-subunit dehydrogenase